MAYTDYAASFVAADKPVTALLMGYIRDNTRYIKDRLVTGTGHTHNQAGTDEGGPVTPADNSVTIAKLSRAQGSQNYSGSSDGTYYLTVPAWTHLAHFTINTGPAGVVLTFESSGASGTVRQIKVVITSTNANSNLTIYWDYHT